MEDPRIRKFAQYIIKKAVGLKKGEKILIELHGDPQAAPLAKALIEEAYTAGGFPYFQKYDYILEGAVLKGTSQEHMRNIASYEIRRMKDMDAYVDIRASQNIHEWNDVPKDKMAIYNKEYWGPIHLSERCNHTKWTVIRYPNQAMAQLAGMSTEEYENFYFNACLVDYDKMGESMKPLVELMSKTDRVRIVGPKTDLTFSIKGIPVIGTNGGNNIPDGEILTAPVKDSANGFIYYNVPSPYGGEVFRDMYLEFKDGKIINASSNLTDKMNMILDTDEGARYVGEFAIGVNPIITSPMLDILFDEKMTGSFHFTPGNAYDVASNGNHSAQHWDMISLQTPEYGGGEIYFDDVLVRKDGRFVLPQLNTLNPENLLYRG